MLIVYSMLVKVHFSVVAIAFLKRSILLAIIVDGNEVINISWV